MERPGRIRGGMRGPAPKGAAFALDPLAANIKNSGGVSLFPHIAAE